MTSPILYLLMTSPVLYLLMTASVMTVVNGLVRSPYSEDQPSKRYLEVYVICDYYCYQSLIQELNTDDGVLSNLFDTVQFADKVMSRLNISLILVGLEVWNKTSFIKYIAVNQTYEDATSIMKTVISRRANHLARNKFSADTMLITGIRSGQSGNEIRGLHSPGTTCADSSIGMVVRLPGDSSERIATLFAHELGHGIGMVHDATSCTCHLGPDHCVMATLPQYSAATAEWSSCSLQSFANFINSTRSDCVMIKQPETGLAFSSPMAYKCGNGVIDPGEQCDCGAGCLPAGCCKCCVRCQLAANAQCADGKCCNVATCSFQPSKTLCDASNDATCDLDNFCNGTSAQCPQLHQADFTDCVDATGAAGYCQQGSCSTINTQCINAWGSGAGASSQSCYNYLLTTTTSTVNCGYDSNNNPVTCSRDQTSHYMCNPLLCNTVAASNIDKARTGTVTVAGEKCTYSNNSAFQTAVLGVGGQIEVQSGTKCGINMACLNGNCLPKDVVVTQLNAFPFQEIVSYCGDGILDDGEECDCAPFQCGCCEIDTCLLLTSGTACYDTCGICDGVSANCTRMWTADADFSPCNNGDGQCYGGLCVSLDAACKRYFTPLSSYKRWYYLRNANITTPKLDMNGGGYFVSDPQTINTFISSEFKVADGNGACGVLHCVAPQAGRKAYVDFGTGPVFSVTGSIQDPSGFMRYVYYQGLPDSLLFTGDGINYKLVPYRTMFPILADDGTPCTTASGAQGYCMIELFAVSKEGKYWYYYSNCIAVGT